jgi:hypothetical protein
MSDEQEYHKCLNCSHKIYTCSRWCHHIVAEPDIKCAECIQQDIDREAQEKEWRENERKQKMIDKDTKLMNKLIMDNYFVKDPKVDMRIHRLKKKIDLLSIVEPRLDVD